MKEFRRILKGNVFRVITTIVLNIATSFAMVTAGYSLSFIFTGYESEGSRGLVLAQNCLVVFLIWLIAIMLFYVSGVYQAGTIKTLKNELRLLVAKKISSIEYDEFADKDSGNFVSWLTNDVENITSQTYLPFFSIITSICTVAFSIGALFLISSYVGVAAIVLFFFVSVVPQIATKKLKKAIEERSIAQEESLEQFKDSIMGFPVFYLTRLFDALIGRISNASSSVEKANYSFAKRNLAIRSFVTAMSVLGQIVILTVTVLAAILGAAPIGAVVSVGNLSGSFFNSVSDVAQGFAVYKASKALWNKFEVTGQQSEGLVKIDQIGDVDLSNIRFCYGDKEILNIDSLQFKKGGKYALVGESGSGKTTLVKLMVGLLENYEGSILYNGIDVRQISKDSLYRKVAYVDQKVYLFQDTLRFNITLGMDYSDDQIIRAIERSRLDSYVASLPDGLDTQIAEDGKNLSGGQRQRIALARSLIRGVNLLILDEGTAALDDANALDIELNLVEDSEIGLIVITHNLRDPVREKLDAVYELLIRPIG